MSDLPETSRPPLSEVKAWTYLGVNLLATPGLGSVWGGRPRAGRGQLFFSVTGFCLIVSFIFKFSLNISEAEISGTPASPVAAGWWQGGVLAFGMGWLWSLFTSISLVRQARKDAVRVPPKLAVPPRLVPPKL